MTRLERIARDLAAVLSPKGESDWRRYMGMAEEVGIRLHQQFADIISSDVGCIAPAETTARGA
jgi:hypothetical protein